MAEHREILEWLRVAGRDDLFSSIRSDTQLAGMVRKITAAHKRPFALLLSHLIGSDPKTDEGEARRFWLAAVQHRREMAYGLGRPVALRVAALDLLSAGGTTRRLKKPVLLSPRLLGQVIDALGRDALTGLATRDRFLAILEHELAQRHTRPVIVAYADVRGLKRVNDTFGHARGDQLLQSVGDAWRKVCRRGDLMARLGGDEFGALFVECKLADARAVMERVQAALSSEQHDLDTKLSFGFAAARPKDTAESLVTRADQVMYASRRRGDANGRRAVRPPTERSNPPPVAVYATRTPERLLELHTRLAARGVLVLPARTAAMARTLVTLAAPHIVMADAMMPPKGGATLLTELARGSKVGALVLPPGWSRSATAAGRVVLRLPVVDEEISALVQGVPQKNRPPLPSLASLDQAALLIVAVAALLGGRARLITDPDIARRQELDIVRRLLGS